MRIERDYPSKTSDKIYHTQVDDVTGLLSCNCRGWTSKKEGKPRFCINCKDLAAEYNLELVERDGQMFVVAAGSPVMSQAIPPAGEVRETGAPAPSSFIKPMLASKLPDGWDADRYDAARFVMEEKFDGHRIIAAVSDGKVQAWSRYENQRTLPAHVAEQVAQLPDGVYDGELVTPGGHSYDVTAGQNSGTEVLILFDLVGILGESVTGKPLDERRQLLEQAFKALDEDQKAVALAVQEAPSMAGVRKIWARGGEGAIIKRRSGHYQPGWRTGDWVKVKVVGAATLTIIGFEPGKVGPYSAVRLRNDQGLETSVKTINNVTMRQIAADPDSFVGKRLVISFQERTPKGHYRHPMWDHLAGAAE